MISLSRCELVIDFLGQLFCVLNEILYSLLVSEFCEPCLTDECTKAKRPSFECSLCSKSYWYFEGTFGFFFLLICSGHFHLYPRWKGVDQISERVLLFSFFAWSVSRSLYGVYNPHISGFVFLKTRSFYPSTIA